MRAIIIFICSTFGSAALNPQLSEPQYPSYNTEITIQHKSSSSTRYESTAVTYSELSFGGSFWNPIGDFYPGFVLPPGSTVWFSDYTITTSLLWPAVPTADLPTTAVLTTRWEDSGTYVHAVSPEGGGTWTTVSTRSLGGTPAGGPVSATATYSVFPPDPTYMAGGTLEIDLPCNASCADLPPEDGECAAQGPGKFTRCEGQCLQRTDGNFWCPEAYNMAEWERGAGRVCWDRETPGRSFALERPCLMGDLRSGCSCTE